MPNTSFSNLKVKLASKFGNKSTKYYSDEDRRDALNWSRNILGAFDFPELITSDTLTVTSSSLYGETVGRAGLPATLARVVEIFEDVDSEFGYRDPKDFKKQSGNIWTIDQSSGTRYFFIKPSTTTALYIRFVKQVVQWAADGALLSEFDPRWDDLIVDGAIGWLKLKGKNYEEKELWKQEFYGMVKSMFEQARQGGWVQGLALESVYIGNPILQNR